MNRSVKQILAFVIAMIFLISACMFGQSGTDTEKFTNLVMTSVALTVTAFPTSTPMPTDTPSLTPTEIIPTIQFTAVPNFIFPTSTSVGIGVQTATLAPLGRARLLCGGSRLPPTCLSGVAITGLSSGSCLWFCT